MKIYISGRITGLELEAAKLNFIKAEIQLLKKYNCDVINPVKLVPFDPKSTWKDYMIKDIKLLFDCDTIYMLRNWKESRGARIEHFIAKEIGLKVIYQEN